MVPKDTPPWTRHEIFDGQCMRCGLAIPGLRNGPVWIKLDARAICEPMSRVEECA
jgi:hypothetical protein